MYKHRFTRLFPSGCFFPMILVFGIMTLGTLMLILDFPWLFLATIPVWILIATMEEGIQIDWETKQYRNYKRIFLLTGNWKPLPPKIIEAKLVSGNETMSFNSAQTMGAQRSVKKVVYRVKLQFNTSKGEKGMSVFQSDDRAEAESKLKYFKDTLKKYGSNHE